MCYNFQASFQSVMELFVFALPNTPPKKDVVDQMAFKKAFGLFRFTSFTVLVFQVWQ